MFRDRYVSLETGQLFHGAADSCAVAVTFLFASGIPLVVGSTGDAFLLIVWAIVPRYLSRVCGDVIQRVSFSSALLMASCLVLLTGGLLFGGVTLLIRAGTSEDSAVHSLVLATWMCGLFLFVPRVSLIHDLLLMGTWLLAVTGDRPGAAVYLPLFLFSFGLSAATRLQLQDVFADTAKPRPNLHNAAVNAAILASVGAVLFVGSRSLATGLIPPPEEPAVSSGSEGRGRSATKRLPGEEGTEEEDTREMNNPFSNNQDPESSAQVGFAQQVRLGSLQDPQRDSRKVLVALLREMDGRFDASVKGPLSPGALWKGVTLDHFDAGREEWTSVPDSDESARTTQDEADVARANLKGDRIGLRMEVLQPVFNTLVAPYHAGRFLSTETSSLGLCQINRHGDVFPESGVPAGSNYDVLIRVHPGLGESLRDASIGVHPDERYLRIPAASEIGVDLRAIADDLFLGLAAPRDKVLALRGFLQSRFTYHDRIYWGGERQLARFLIEERKGNCEFFATAAALILRGGSVSTRVVAGFLGGTWDPVNQLYEIRNSMAHLWVEVYLPDTGWIPIDPTDWVPDGREESETNREAEPNASDAPEESPAPPDDLARSEPPRTEPPQAEPDRPPDPTSPEPPSREDEAASLSAAETEAEDSTEERASDRRETESARRSEVSQAESESGSRALAGGAEGQEPSTLFSAGVDPFSNLGELGEGDGTETEGEDSETGVETEVGAIFGWMRPALLALCAVALGWAFLRTRLARSEALEDAESDEEDETVPDPLAPEQGSLVAWTPVGDARDPVLLEYSKLQKHLARSRAQRLSSETPREHARRLVREQTLEDSFRRLNRLLYPVLYRGHLPSAEEVQRFRESCREVRSKLG